MFIDDFWLLTVTIVLAILSPGPSFVGVTRHFLRYGFQKTMIFNAGISAGENVLSALVLLGLSSTLLSNNYLYATFHIFSGAYLLYVGSSMIRSNTMQINLLDNTLSTKPIKTNNFLPGFFIGVSNPKSLVFDMAVLSTFITPQTTSTQKFTLWLWLLLLSWLVFTVVCYFFNIFREKLLNYLGYFEKACGILLIGLGCKLLYTLWENIPF